MPMINDSRWLNKLLYISWFDTFFYSFWVSQVQLDDLKMMFLILLLCVYFINVFVWGQNAPRHH